MGTVDVQVALPPELCVHWWRIGYPNGPTTIGKCEKCGREKVYQTPYMSGYNKQPLNEPSTTAAGRKLKRDWGDPLEWKEPEWHG